MAVKVGHYLEATRRRGGQSQAGLAQERTERQLQRTPLLPHRPHGHLPVLLKLGVALLASCLCQAVCAINLRPFQRNATPLIPLSAWPAVLSGEGTTSRQARTPLLGWNTYNIFPRGVNEALVKQMAQALVQLGLRDLGYVYISLDDDWAESKRDQEGNLVPHKRRYPNGMASLAKHLHSLGLKFGIYSSAGVKTCHKSQPGSLGFEDKDAGTFVSWGVDYLKYDNCNGKGIDPKRRFGQMRKALDKLARRRDVVMNLCAGGAYRSPTWARGIADTWRTAGDQFDRWENIMGKANRSDQYAQYTGPNGFPDLDALEVGNGGMTIPEYRVHFTIWAIIKSTLMLGADLRKISPWALQMVSNKEVLAINQDPLGVAARRVISSSTAEVWAGPLAPESGDVKRTEDFRLVVALVNKGDKTQTIRSSWKTLRLSRQARFTVRNIWEKKRYRSMRIGTLRARVQPHDVALFILSPEKAPTLARYFGQ